MPTNSTTPTRPVRLLSTPLGRVITALLDPSISCKKTASAAQAPEKCGKAQPSV